MKSEEIIHELPKGIIKWYEFHKGYKALYVACGLESDISLQEALHEEGVCVDVINVIDISSSNIVTSVKYDYVVMAGALERSLNPIQLLDLLRSILNEDGILLLIADNRLGIRYFCGDRDIFTDNNFDSIENYTRLNPIDRVKIRGHAYAKAEIKEMLEIAGFTKHHFYSVFPNIYNPQILFSDDYTPIEELDLRIFPQYNYPGTVFLNEETLYSTLIKNGLFHPMANGFFVECPLKSKFNGAKQVTISMERGKKNAYCTIIRNDNKVLKRPVYKENNINVSKLLNNNTYLECHGVCMVEAYLEDDKIVMPYVNAEIATDYFRRILLDDIEMFYKEFDRFRDIVLHSSSHVPYEDVDWNHFEPNWRTRKVDDPNREKWRNVANGSNEERNNLGVILKRGYIDLVPLNCFFSDGKFVFFDQESYIENLPANVILYRSLYIIYSRYPIIEHQLPWNKLLEHYNLKAYDNLWNQFNVKFLDELRNDRVMASYYMNIRKDRNTINANRNRMNFSVEEYDKLFRDIFKDTDGRQIYLFGSGDFAKKFVNQFGKYYEIAGIFDNDPNKWGKELNGIKIYPPEYLQELVSGTYKIIVCIKNCIPIIKQLKKLGIRNYSVYNSAVVYDRIKPIKPLEEDIYNNGKKKYNVGYIAGVFDMFHIGHLNLLKRAKEQCDYLIVGVVTDDDVMNNKKTMPCIPFSERIEIVRSCKYVDEAVEIPINKGDTYEMYKRYQFDVQFSGSDYEENPDWIAKQTFLRKHGSDMVFFPYTQSTSSTKLKALIEKKLL